MARLPRLGASRPQDFLSNSARTRRSRHGTEVAVSPDNYFRDACMSLLGRRKHSRFLLAQPIDGRVRVRDEVTIESLEMQEIMVLAAESCRPDEHVDLEILGEVRHRISARVLESKPVVAEDGAIRHRVRLAPVGTSATEDVAGEM